MFILDVLLTSLHKGQGKQSFHLNPFVFNALLFVMKVRESALSRFSSLKDFFKHVLMDELPQQILSPFLTWENCSFPVEFLGAELEFGEVLFYTHLKYCIPLPSCLRFLRNWMCSCICLTAGSCCFLWIYIRIFLCFWFSVIWVWHACVSGFKNGCFFFSIYYAVLYASIICDCYQH